MKREEAKEIIISEKSRELHTYGKTKFVEALDVAIQALEQTRWIPVSERLPMNDDDVLVSCEDGFVRIGFCMGYDESGNREWCVAGKYSKVMAWMPMPKSYHYKKEGE